MTNEFNVIVDRFRKAETHTLSRFYFDGTFIWKGNECNYVKWLAGYGIEDVVRNQKIYGITAIPAGKYKLTLTHSPKFSNQYFRNEDGNIIRSNKRNNDALCKEYTKPHECVLINQVPGYSRVLIHWGNTVNDTEGCYIVGSSIGEKDGMPAVLNSRSKYEQIYPIMFRAIKSGANVFIIIS